MKARNAPMTDAEYEAALVDDIGKFYDDPLGFIYYAFEWNKGDLEGQEGPDTWQTEMLESIGKKLKADPEATIREATASGHGIGKTALVAWLILWAMSTRPHLAGVVTANTMAQLTTKTWRELALWYKRLLHKHWWKWSATKFWHVQHPETWAMHATPNSEHSSEAFAGLHARYVLVIFDEASAIPDKIWEVTEGALTTPRAQWYCFGNPTKATGRFRDCFERDSGRWTTRHVDSRTAKMTNKKELDEWIKTYGIQSDFVKVRVLGQFPSQGMMQFIPTSLVDQAMLRETIYESWCHAPIVIGVDVARFGTDQSCICIRQGRKVHEIRKYREKNTMEVASEVVKAIRDYQGAIAIFIDGVGVGAGVVDRLQQLGHNVIEINGGAKAYDEVQFFNATAEQWYRMREWLRGADLPERDFQLRLALIGREFTFDDRERMRMERKIDMAARGLQSPDEADALAHTFAEELGDYYTPSFEPTLVENSVEPS